MKCTLENLYYIFSIGAVIIALVTLITTLIYRHIDNKGKPYAYISSAGELLCIVVINIGKNIITNVWLDLDVCKLGGKDSNYDQFTYTLLPGDKMIYISSEQSTINGDFVIKGKIKYTEGKKQKSVNVEDRLSRANTLKISNQALATVRKYSVEDNIAAIENNVNKTNKSLDKLIYVLNSRSNTHDTN